ncbi:hypothetical protein SESBI_45789 [Sesbania bispinosa]|nr:hypothetical protein SESBI_45789 [Sesbania bispinosa]
MGAAAGKLVRGGHARPQEAATAANDAAEGDGRGDKSFRVFVARGRSTTACSGHTVEEKGGHERQGCWLRAAGTMATGLLPVSLPFCNFPFY